MRFLINLRLLEEKKKKKRKEKNHVWQCNPQHPGITFKTNGASCSYQLSTTGASIKENL